MGLSSLDVYGRAFMAVDSLNITANDVPDLTTVSSMQSMFNDTNLSIANNINDWDVSNVTNMTSMFSSSSFGQAIGNWNTSNVTTMWGMFYDATAFNQDLSSWDTSAVTDMEAMFLAQLPLTKTSALGHQRGYRYGAMFLSATAFNQDLSNWDTSKVTMHMWKYVFIRAQLPLTKTLVTGTSVRLPTWQICSLELRFPPQTMTACWTVGVNKQCNQM